MSTEANKALARRYYEAGQRNDFVAWDEVCDPAMVLDVGFVAPIQGLEAVKQYTAGMHSAFPDFSLRMDDAIAEGDRVAVRWSMDGTHTADLMTPNGLIPPTGKHVAMSGISILRMKDGKILEERVQADILGMMQQLGVVPPPQ